jgi:hypothetical protein
MDLHAWITQQVEQVEAAARAELEYRRVVFEPHDGGPAITGTVTGVTQTPDGLQLDVAQYGVKPRDETSAPVQSATAVLRRCEADRRILAIHRRAIVGYSNACDGCGTAGICDDWITEDINECPILLAIAHAHGITDEILASLDRPQPPEPKLRADDWLTQADDYLHAASLGRAAPRTPMRDVPAALRGPHWKP